MTKQAYRFIALVAVCSLVAAVLTYSHAMADNPGTLHEESNICMLDTSDTSTFEETPVSSAGSATIDDAEAYMCNYASCRFSPCPEDHIAAPFFCDTSNYCCVPW